MNRYLVTGVAGFIASHVAQRLLDFGHEVVGVDNVNDYYDTRIKEYRVEALKKSARFTFHRLDIEDYEGLRPLFAGKPFDAVFNLAARAGVRASLENPHIYLRTNAGGTLNLLEHMRYSGCRKFVLASTSSLYAGQPMPFREDLPTSTPISP